MEEKKKSPTLRILVAEDEAINRRVIVDYLRERGHSMAAVGDGASVSPERSTSYRETRVPSFPESKSAL